MRRLLILTLTACSASPVTYNATDAADDTQVDSTPDLASQADSVSVDLEPAPDIAPDAPTCADLNCDDGKPCTVDGCAYGKCTHEAVAVGTPCDDGKWCTGHDFCAYGHCAGMPEMSPCFAITTDCAMTVCHDAEHVCEVIKQKDGKVCGNMGQAYHCKDGNCK